MNIRKVDPSEAPHISALAIRSKAHWGYDEQFMASCANELSHTPIQIDDAAVVYRLAEANGVVTGFYKLEDLNKDVIVLDALFVDPNVIGAGVGRALLTHALDTAKQFGARYVEAQSDPYAEGFYRAMGANVVGRAESGSIPGRFLPTIRFDLS
ncbi:N-acetyltransferase [Arenicella chitinivorans]|uniref:N-acetyltransferase n=1 Tax=Arenicella chitinivorans TaxID=1329800 RepID=A0A918VJE0_9GAMM|nr:GNAT family N-acetyltransferase [Arenicella chitinivorans]GHA03726.1 N-acetyltransferase [Arenicella chitinivorans]